MATVALWKVESNLKQVIDYTTDEEKINIDNINTLDKSLKYIVDEDKTNMKVFVSGVNCSSDNALEEMNLVKKQFMKTDGVLAWHGYQSFKENEVTPEQAHKIGVELANEMWGDKFQVVVSTHLNTNHIHNHFVVNSVSFVNGKKYNANRSNYAELRRLNDLICLEHGLSHLEETKTKSGINYTNYQNKNIVYINYYKTTKRDIDEAIEISSNYDDFKNILKNMGYEIYLRANKLSVKGKDYKRNIRIERYYGNDYSVENIKKRINRIYIPEDNITKNYYKKNNKKLFKNNYNSFYSMYVRYCYLLGIYKNIVKKIPVSKKFKEDVHKLELFNKEIIMMDKYEINTKDDFEKFYSKKILELNTLNKDNECNIDSLKEEIKLCEDISKRNKDIKQEIKNIEEREMIENEYIR